MTEVYLYQGFDHALSYDLNYPRPDVLAVLAWHKGQVVGIAGASADSDQWWQIGIDVVPEHQGVGLGRALVSQATAVILEKGKAPYYTHSISNIRSGNTARSLGYQLAWVDVYVRDLAG